MRIAELDMGGAKQMKLNKKSATDGPHNVAEAAVPLTLPNLKLKRSGNRVDIHLTLPCHSRVDMIVTDTNRNPVYTHSGAYCQGTHLIGLDAGTFPSGEYLIECRTCLGVLLDLFTT